MSKSELKMLIDQSGVNSMLGTVFILDELGRQSRYMQNLIECAYEQANTEFNLSIVAFASATGRMGHMFEWGTVGINTSESNMSLDPMEKRAQLWTNIFKPGRKWSTLSYTFNPSVATVPKPPAEKTGIDERILSKLRDHVFWNKAFVMETGEPVTIRPKADNVRGLLFVPNIWKGEDGYSMYSKNTHPDISAKTKGTFTTYWTEFFEGQGAVLMQGNVEKWFEEDLYMAVRMIRSKSTLHIPDPTIDKRQIESSKRTARKYFERAAQERLAANIEYDKR